jgi:DNA-binding NarL/FixJ family response regulator
MALIARDISVILLDLGLPDRDGFSALAEVRERYRAISVVVLSISNKIGCPDGRHC